MLKKGGGYLVLLFLKAFDELLFFSFLSPTKEDRPPVSILCLRFLAQGLTELRDLLWNICFGCTLPKAIHCSFSIVRRYLWHSPLSSSMKSLPSEMMPRCNLTSCLSVSLSSSSVSACCYFWSASSRFRSSCLRMCFTSALTGAISHLYSSSIRHRSSFTRCI